MRESSWLAILAMALVACGGGEGDEGRADSGPTSRADASRNPGADAASAGCDPRQPSDCSGETICIGDSCESAFGRTYSVYVYNLDVASQDTEGVAWDGGGGAPDPFVNVHLNGQLILATSIDQDTFTPEFGESVDVVIPAGARLEFNAWDEDISEHDWILGCIVDPLTADYLRIYGPVCQGNAETGTAGTVLDIAIVPKG